MGRYITQVGKYRAEYGDYLWDYVKDKQPLEYYQKKTFEVTITNIITKEEFEVKVPILDNFIYVTLLRKNYTFNHIDDGTLFKWLFYYVLDELKENLYAVGYIDVRTYKKGNEYDYEYKKYYQFTKMFVSPVTLVDDPNEKTITQIYNMEQVRWYAANGLELHWCDENGNTY